MIPGLDLQSKNLLELLKEPFGLTRIVPVSLQPGHKRNLRFDVPLTVRDVLVGKLDMPGGDLAINYRVHGLKLTAQG